MNILYVIGNGFDLNLELKTSYEDFFEYYKDQYTSNPVLIDLKDNIKGKKKDWSDLELALGKYLKELKSEEEFDVVFDDIRFYLSEFLNIQERNFDSKKIDQSTFVNYLINPEKELLISDRIKLSNYISNWKGQGINLELTTFNYTTIIDKLIIDKIKKGVIGTRPDGGKVHVSRLLHIHGTVEKNMILGINDESQLENDDLKKNSYVKNSFIKEDCNNIFKNENNNIFKSQISKANLIVVFGCSIGESDKIWWQRITSRIREGCKLILFKKGVALHPLQQNKLFKYENEIIDDFFRKSGIVDLNKTNDLRENIFIGLNTNMFNFIPFLNE